MHWRSRKTLIQSNKILTDAYKRWQYKYLNSASKWCPARNEQFCTLLHTSDPMSWLFYPKTDKFSYFYHLSPFQHDIIFKEPLLWQNNWFDTIYRSFVLLEYQISSPHKQISFLFIMIKGHLCYKTITYQNVLSEVQVKNLFIF